MVQEKQFTTQACVVLAPDSMLLISVGERVRVRETGFLPSAVGLHSPLGSLHPMHCPFSQPFLPDFIIPER